MPKDKSLEDMLQENFRSLMKEVNDLPNGEDKIAKKTTALSAATKFLAVKNKLKPEGDDEPSFAIRAGKLIHDSPRGDSGGAGRSAPIDHRTGGGLIGPTPGYGLLTDDTEDA